MKGVDGEKVKQKGLRVQKGEKPCVWVHREAIAEGKLVGSNRGEDLCGIDVQETNDTIVAESRAHLQRAIVWDGTGGVRRSMTAQQRKKKVEAGEERGRSKRRSKRRSKEEKQKEKQRGETEQQGWEIGKTVCSCAYLCVLSQTSSEESGPPTHKNCSACTPREASGSSMALTSVSFWSE